MNPTRYGFLTLLLIGVEWLYLKLARRYAFLERSNERSLHQQGTSIRAGGFIIWLAALMAWWLDNQVPACFSIALTCLALVSLWDDFFELSKRFRLSVHVLAVSILVLYITGYTSPWYLIAGLIVMGVAVLNIYNFMDGINGMLALYSLVTIGTLWFVQTGQHQSADSLYASVGIALLVFACLNVRPLAICFAGDVGSVSMGFIVLYGIGICIRQTQSYLPFLFVAVYGVDGLFTILYRLYLGQNIVTAHRMHLYQLLVRSAGWPHGWVAALYALVQLGINGLVIMGMSRPSTDQLLIAGLVIGGLSAGYGIARSRVGRA